MLWPERNKEIWDDWWGIPSSPWRTDLSPKFVTSTFLHYESQNNMFLKCTNDVSLSDLHTTAYKEMLLQQEYGLLWWLVPSFIFPLPRLKSFTCEHWCYIGTMIAQGLDKLGGGRCVSPQPRGKTWENHVVLVTLYNQLSLPFKCVNVGARDLAHLL